MRAHSWPRRSRACWPRPTARSSSPSTTTGPRAAIVQEFVPRFEGAGIDLVIQEAGRGVTYRTRAPAAGAAERPVPRARGGVGYARNRAVEAASGEFLCFFDADDVMMPGRVELQVREAAADRNALVGSLFLRIPLNATLRYADWANGLSHEELYTEQYRENTLIQPTWLMHRDVFERQGGYEEDHPTGTPEDLIFFHRHLDLGGTLRRVDRVLLLYRYHPAAASFSVPAASIFAVRAAAFQRRVLARPPWSDGFTIWNAGKEGGLFYRSLSPENRAKVVAFCDVDEKKIRQPYWDAAERRHIPIVHFSAARPPVVTCVKGGLTGGAFEANLASMGWRPGVDFFCFA
eukprot:tig00000802_g4273.t1